MTGFYPPEEQLLAFFKALAEANRLKIIGLLAQKTCSVEELASLLGLKPSTVSHHLTKLSEVGLVSARAESYYNIYQLEPKALEVVAHSLLAKDSFPTLAAQVDINAYDRKIVEDFLLPTGKLKVIPAQRNKREAVLRYIIQSFEPGVHYTEKQVNEILSRYHADVATLRRELIAYKHLTRTGGEYWVTEK